MKFIANALNGEYIMNILPPDGAEVEEVLAAIAYGDLDGGERLLNLCVERQYPMNIWMRYDHTVPVAPAFLKKLLHHMRDGVFCHLIPDRLHSKVLWLKGHGVYIGSANLTDRAWNNNIEAGVFFTDEELHSSGMDEQLESFFSELESLDKAFPLTEDIYLEQKKLQALQRSKEAQMISDESLKRRSQPFWEGMSYIEAQTAKDRKKEAFRTEWDSAVSFMQHIAQNINDFRPEWIAADVPEYWQVDQFLHAYYYNKVRDGSAYPYEQMHQSCKGNPQARLLDMLSWWKALPAPPSDEDRNLGVNAPLIRQHLARDKVRTLSKEELGEVLAATHATRNHYSKISPSVLGKPGVQTLSMEERDLLFGELMSTMKNKKGQSIQELLYYVLYGGKPASLWERIYLAGYSDELKIDRYGISSIAEVAGWALPEYTPPRNGRTNKALRALGYPVRVHM